MWTCGGPVDTSGVYSGIPVVTQGVRRDIRISLYDFKRHGASVLEKLMVHKCNTKPSYTP